MPEQLVPRINSHVSRLNRFLPFSPAHDQIYEEYQTGDDALDLDTIAIAYATRAIRRGARCIVLTGDAGHGKTHMCRRLIEDVLGYRGADSRNLLRSKCDGSTPIDSVPQVPPIRLRVHKDFSELEPKAAALLLESVTKHPNETLVICANEGRLRAIVASQAAGPVCAQIASTFKRSFENGLISHDGSIHIVNLNYQSVAATGESGDGSLLRRTLRKWASDRRRWDPGCSRCSLLAVCPVQRNRAMLSAEDDVSVRRVEHLEALCSTVERLGHVITIREMLMLAAYLLTGGLTCEDVRAHDTTYNHQIGWQHAWSFFNLLFQAPPGTPDDRIYKGIPVLEIFRRLDPGALAVRDIDDRLLNLGGTFEGGNLDLQFFVGAGARSRQVDAAYGIDEFAGDPQSKSELARETESTRRAVHTLRRRAFFDGESDSLMARLGFRHGDSFLAMLDENLAGRKRAELRNLVVAGLHSIQGLRMSQTETVLHVVDPAFGRASDDAAIIARRISTVHILLLSSRNAWTRDATDWMLANSVDWIDRTVVVRVEEQPGGERSEIALDLLAFECVARSAAGYVSEEFYAREIRRIRSFLGHLAERGRGEEGEISLFMAGRVHNVSIDNDFIQVGG